MNKAEIENAIELLGFIGQAVGNKISRALSEVDISRSLRVLGKLGILGASTKQQLEKLRNIRNKIAHRGHLATKQEANETIDICKKFLLSLSQVS